MSLNLLERFLRLFRPEEAPKPVHHLAKGMVYCPHCERRVAYFPNTGKTSRHTCLEGVRQVSIGDERLNDVK